MPVQMVPLAWVNMMVFDYEGRLQTGRQELHAWPCDTQPEDEVNFMGSNVLNLSTSEYVSVDIEVIEPRRRGVPAGKPIMYPTEEQINKFAKEVSQVSIPAVSCESSLVVVNIVTVCVICMCCVYLSQRKFKKANTSEVQILQRVIEGDPLAQLDEQDKELVWRAR